MKCYDCSAPPAEGRARCEKHLADRREAMRRFQEANRDRIAAQRAKRYAMQPVAKRNETNFRQRYGISYADFEAMHEAQQGLCAICLEPETSRGNHGKVKNLSVDHDHMTGKVRGLLCNNCNRSLGLLKDDPFVLVRAFLYLTDEVMS